MLLLQNKYNIIVALISLGGGLLVPHLIMLVWDSNNNSSSSSSSSSSNANVVLLSHWNDQWINLRRWIQTSTTTTIAPATTTTSIHHVASFPLDMYQNKTHYLDATVRNNERKSSVLLDTTTTSSSSSSSSHAPTQSQQYPCTPERQLDFLHDTKIPGYHVLCFTTVADTHNDAGENNIHHHHPASYTLTVYRYGVMDETNSKQNIYTTTIIPHQMSWSQFQSDIISNHIIFRRRDNTHRTTHQQPYALFTMDGQRIIDKDSIEGKNDTAPWFVEVMAQQLGMVLLYEGGQFVWPGVRVGYERHVALYSIMPPIHSPNNHNMEEHHHHRHPAKPNNMNVTLVTLSLSPLVLSVHGFLSVDECRYIQTMATPTMAYSDVVLMDHDAGRPASDFRTSQTTFLDANDDAILTDIDYRTASLTRVPRNHQEPVQVLRYGISEKYSAHYDYFNPKSYQNDIDTLRLIRHGTRNRFATVFWYLSTVPEGGETIFPRAYGQYERSNSDCDTGLKVRPEVGKVIIFYNMKMDGTIDPQSLHGACPVRQGIKWAANKWIWNEPMSYVPP